MTRDKAEGNNRMPTDIEKSLTIIVKGAGIIFLGQVISLLLGMVNQILLGRFLGPGDYGLLNLGLSVIMIASILPVFGLGPGLVQFIPFNITLGRQDKVIGGIDFSFKFCLAVGALVSLVVFFLSKWIAIEIFHDANLEVVIKILCISLTFTAFYRLAQGLPAGFRQPKYKLYNEFIIMKLLRIAVFLIAIFVGYKLLGALAAYIVAKLSASVGYLFIYYRRFYPSLNCKHKDRSAKRDLLSLSWPLFLTGFTALFISHTDKIVLGIYMTSSDIGIYTAALTLASSVYFIHSSFRYLFLPTIAEYFAREDIPGIQKLFSSVTKWIFLLTFPVVIYLFFFSEDVIQLIYGGAFTRGYLALFILSVGYASIGITGLTGEILVATRRTRLNLLNEVIGAGSNVGLNILLIPRYGIIGAAIATSASFILMRLIGLGFVYKLFRIHPYNFQYVKILMAATVPLVAISLLLKTYFDIPWAFLIVIPIFLAVYSLLLLKTGCLDKFDKSIMRAILAKMRVVK